MRDESGEMMWNAHILGSLRRILKMLFHGIRPVFVFDGATPEIKMREVKERRDRRERGNVNVKRTAKRLLVEALKANNSGLLGSKAGSKDFKESEGQVDERGAFAAGFVDGTANEHEEKAEGGATKATHETKAGRKKDEELPAGEAGQNVDANMEGVFDVDDDSEDETNWEDGNAQTDPNEAWETSLPENGELDMEVVRGLPKDMRKDVVEKAKSRHRVSTRKQYMPVAADPMAFSNVQLVNFLKASKMNKSIEKMAKDEIGNTDEGFVMASDRSKLIVMKDKVEDDIDFSYMQRGDSSGSSSDEDNDDNEEEEDKYKEKEELRGAQTSGATKRGFEGGKNDSSGSSSEDEEEGEQEKADRLDKVGEQLKSKKAVTFNSSGSSSEEEVVVVKEVKATKNATVKTIASGKKQQRKRYEDDQSSDEEGETTENKKWAEEQMRRDEQVALEFQREEEESAARSRKEVSTNEQIALELQRGEEEDAALRFMSGPAEDDFGAVADDEKEEGGEEDDNKDDEDDDEEDVDWEDGDETGRGARDDTHKNTSITLDFSAPRPTYNFFDNPSPPPQENIEAASDEELTAAQAAAFSEAAADAKKLTSWAGRAVARAIKQHVGHVPQAKTDGGEEGNPAGGNGVEAIGVDEGDEYINEAGDDMPDGNDSENNNEDQFLPPETTSVALPPSLDLPPAPKKLTEQIKNRPAERTMAELDESNRLIELAREAQQMQKDMKRGDRDDDGITEDMKEDVINLLKAFGMPYIIAPAEAEAQCCKLEEVRRDEEQSRFDSRGK